MLLQRRLLYRFPRTTRWSHPLNINHLHSDSSSHHSSYLGLTDHPHLQLIYTHTYKTHTHTDSLRSLDLPRLSFLSVIPVYFCVLDLGPLPVILIFFCLPRPRIVSPELCLLAACPDPLPGTRPCLCLTPAVLPCWYLTLYGLTILIKSCKTSVCKMTKCKWIQTLLTHHHRRIRQTAIQRLMQLSTELTAQASQLTLHQHQLTRLSTLTEELVRALQGLSVSSPEAASQQFPIRSSFHPAQTPPISPRLAFPEKFDGEPARSKGFLLQCSFFVNQKPSLYPTDSSRIAFVCSLLTGKALEWVKLHIGSAYAHTSEAHAHR